MSEKMNQEKRNLPKVTRRRQDQQTCRRWIFRGLGAVTLIILGIYFVPYVNVDPIVTDPLGEVPMVGAWQKSNARDFVMERLLNKRLFAPESVPIDSSGHVYMAIHGGFVLRAKFDPSLVPNGPGSDHQRADEVKVYKIADLNQQKMPGVDEANLCTRDEQLYGSPLIEVSNTDDGLEFERSNVIISRCSIPLGVRLSRNEDYLYVIDTLQGLFKVSLKVPIEPMSSQRLVTKMLDWNDDEIKVTHYSNGEPLPANFNVKLKAMDDLVVDEGAGTQGGDIIYMTAANRKWSAHEFMYAVLESRYSGFLLRYDTGSQKLTVVDGMTQVRIAPPNDGFSSLNLHDNSGTNLNKGIGAPDLDSPNDVFDARPATFWNGLELTDDRQALLVADSGSRRIVKHFIRGPRAGQTDLWTWTPFLPDNIRRAPGKRETYWTVGCGHSQHNEPFLTLDTINQWPKMRRILLKSFYLIGSIIEGLGDHVLNSATIANLGNRVRTGVAYPFCSGMMIANYDSNGVAIRTIHGPDFPDDMRIFSEVQEFVNSNESIRTLYLGSPEYKYLGRITWVEDSSVGH